MQESGQDEDGFKNKADDSDSEEYDLPKDNKRAGLKSLFVKETEDLPLGLGEIIERKLGENASGNQDDGFAVAACIARRTERLPVDERLLALKSSNALRQRLAGLLQARTLKHIAPAKIGKLNTAKLYRLNIGNPRIFRKESFVSGVSSAVHILLDASYSMDNARIILARQACYSLAKALCSIKGINPAVTVFPAGFNDDVYPLLKHGQKLTDRFKVIANGGTPLAPALWWVGQTLYPLPESRKIILIITDGIPDNPEAVIRTLETLKKLGMEIYGIGIELDAIKDMLPGSSRTIRNLSELAPAMFHILQDALLRGGKHDGSH